MSDIAERVFAILWLALLVWMIARVFMAERRRRQRGESYIIPVPSDALYGEAYAFARSGDGPRQLVMIAVTDAALVIRAHFASFTSPGGFFDEGGTIPFNDITRIIERRIRRQVYLEIQLTTLAGPKVLQLFPWNRQKLEGALRMDRGLVRRWIVDWKPTI